MPTYDYACKRCGHTFELYQNLSEPVRRKCPECGRLSLQRLFGTGAAVLFKGSGFYETDYKRAPASGKSAPGKSDTGTSSGDASDGGQGASGGKGDGSSGKAGSGDTSTKGPGAGQGKGTAGGGKPASDGESPAGGTRPVRRP